MTTAVELLEFSRFEPAAVIGRMTELAGSLGGWINLQPNVDPNDVPGSGLRLLSIFSARGPAVPLVTWMPGQATRRGATPAEVGIQHPAGSRAVPLLRERGIDVPAGWTVVQDHPKRGLVLRPTDDAAVGDVLEWLLRAAPALCPYELPTSWLAMVHTR
ncbi:MAG: hypothetical protein ACRD0A_06820 [Acidimicrobiales bacterium]